MIKFQGFPKKRIVMMKMRRDLMTAKFLEGYLHAPHIFGDESAK